jgi:hypothetical protein
MSKNAHWINMNYACVLYKDWNITIYIAWLEMTWLHWYMTVMSRRGTMSNTACVIIQSAFNSPAILVKYRSLLEDGHIFDLNHNFMLNPAFSLYIVPQPVSCSKKCKLRLLPLPWQILYRALNLELTICTNKQVYCTNRVIASKVIAIVLHTRSQHHGVYTIFEAQYMYNDL